MMPEGFIFPRGFASLFRVGLSGVQNIPAGVATVVQWDWEQFDALDEMLIVNPWTFTPKQAGYYDLYASVRMSNMAVNEYMQLEFYYNGGAEINTRINQAHVLNQQISLNIHGIRFLTPADVVDVRVTHTLAGLRPIGGTQVENIFIGYRVK